MEASTVTGPVYIQVVRVIFTSRFKSGHEACDQT